MSESFHGSLEDAPVAKEEILQLLKSEGKSTAAIECVVRWVEQRQAEIEKIPSKEKCAKASIEFDIEYAELFKEAGLLEDAWSILNDSIDRAVAFGELLLADQIRKLMGELENTPD